MPKKKTAVRGKKISRPPLPRISQDDARRKTILVLGDVMLDQNISGPIERMSPESPSTPVIRTSRVDQFPGGAANTAANIAALGAKTILAGVVGRDRNAEVLRSLIQLHKITPILIADPDRPTTLKTRIFGNGEHLVRLDDESGELLSPKIRTFLERRLGALKNDVDLVVISDYAKGVLSPEIFEFLIKTFGPEKIIADIKPRHMPIIRGIRAVKPNRHEAEAMSGQKINSPLDAVEAAALLAEKLSSSILLTLGHEGLVAHEYSDATASHSPAEPTEFVDVAGAGDVAIAALALGLASGFDIHESARIANRAAAIAVAKPGTATVTLAEIYT